MQEDWQNKRLRLTWRRTWPSRPKDFACDSPEADMTGAVGRIYLDGWVKSRGQWYWVCYGRIGGGGPTDAAGFAHSKMEAAHLVEAAWFKWVEQAKLEGRFRHHVGNRHEWGRR